MKRTLSILAGVVALFAAAMVGASTAVPASAAPPGAATNLSFGSQVCQSDGTITGTLKWSPSGLGAQYADLALTSSFSNYSSGGPYAASANVVSFVQLKPGTTYYGRIRTAAGGGTLTSDIISISPNCSPGGGGGDAGPTKPRNLQAQALSDGRVRFTWSPGQNNLGFCLDTARDLQHLYGGFGSWSNHGSCWTTSNSLTISGLACDTFYFWLLYTWNYNGSIKSDPAVVRTAPCGPVIGKPTNLNATVLGNGDVRFDWDAGQGNLWYCMDTALNVHDLLTGTGSWSNHGSCWITDTQYVVSNLQCGEVYDWLVYTGNFQGNVKSNIATVETQDCEASLEEAPIVDVDVEKVGTSYRADITAALPNGCHEPDSHRAQRYGNTIQITVWNSVEPGPCTLIYGEYDLGVNLGSNFVKGQSYEVVVNGVVTTFVAN